MNGFIDIKAEEYEINELRKAQLAADLKKQMDEAHERKASLKKQALDEELAIEKRLEKERIEIAKREEIEKQKAEEKNENRRLAALALAEE